MLLPIGLQLEVSRYIRNKPGDKALDQKDGKLEHEHESEACSDNFPVLLGEFIRPNRFMVASIPEI